MHAPAEDRDRGEQREHEDQEAGSERLPIFLSQEIENQKDWKYLDGDAEGYKGAGQPTVSALSCPTCSRQDGKQENIVLTEEKIAMQWKAHREENPYL